jgi:sugar phosphate isomerase/epimerase
VLLSTSSVFPETTAAGFELAATLGYDGVEVMVWSDAVSQDPAALAGLARHYRVPVLAVHAPCLVVTQRVWSPDPWQRLRRAAELAETLQAPTVIVHPPFAWQRDYAKGFAEGLDRLSARHVGISFAVENMFPVRGVGRFEFVPYAPGWDPTVTGHTAYTLDVSHCATSRGDCLAMADRMGTALAHVHLGDGSGRSRDEHLVPGRGNQPCAELLRSLGGRGYRGSVSLEVSTRRASLRSDRVADLAAALRFARQHLGTPTPVDA